MVSSRNRWWRRAGDVAVPWVSGLFTAMVAVDLAEAGRPGAGTVALVAAVIQAVAVTRRRSRPVTAMAAVAVTVLAVQVAAPDTVLSAALLFALGSLAIERPPRMSLVGLAAAAGVTAVSFTTQPAEDPVFGMAVCVAVWSLGQAIRSSRIASREEALRAVAEERAHLEREIHDILAHGLSVMIVQAAAADDVFEARPDAARDALRTIERQGRDALAEIRRLLAPRPSSPRADGSDPDRCASGTGTAPGSSPSRPAVPDGPLPGLGDLPTLAARLAAAGLDLVVDHDGPPRDLPAGVDLSAYRIVQEAATNALRHGRATELCVTVRFGPDGVGLDLADNGRGGKPQGSGRGLIGMRERANLHGGSLETGPLPGGGFAVTAWLPTDAPVPA